MKTNKSFNFNQNVIVLYTVLYFFFFLLFRAAPAVNGGAQARGQIGATAAGLHHSHSNTESEAHV